MELLFEILLFTGLILGACYVFLMVFFFIGWLKTKEEYPEVSSPVMISVIVAVRNEEAVISECLNALLAQEYPLEKFELIVADDYSTDKTGSILELFSAKYNHLRLLKLADNNLSPGKKNAIEAAVDIATGELIVSTDADCVMEKKWLQSIANCYAATNAKMIVAPVAFKEEKTVFEKMQSLEFIALMVSSGGALYFNKAIMCNGANLAYTKSVFNEVSGFSDIGGIASGDDVLLMYKIKKKYADGINYLKNKDAIVYTKAKQTVSEFIQQRKRWASKGFFAMNLETKVVALVVYLFNAFLVITPLIDWIGYRNCFFYGLLTVFCLILIGIKCIIDFLLLFLSASFFKKERFLLLFLPEQLIYMIYVVVIGAIGSMGKYEWKGRKTN